jgi:adenine-specific DNA methylase
MKRLIEEDFPLKKVSEESVREKNIRHGHISTLHIWWARRPLAASRATTYAALIAAPENTKELQEKLTFVATLSKWENSLNKHLIESAKQEIKNFFRGRTPKVLDCFAGGGSIPLEALRLGCETYALEYNPVALLILKAVLEYPQKFGKNSDKDIKLRSVENSFVHDIKTWGNWILDEVKKEIGSFYPKDPDGSIPIGYIWARTIKCNNPSCKAEIPLMRQFWIAKGKGKKIALKPIIKKTDKLIDFEIVQGRDVDFDPSEGTTTKATVLCPICGSGIDGNTLRKEAHEGRMGQRLIAVILSRPTESGKIYRIATHKDQDVFNKAATFLEDKIKHLTSDFNPIPTEQIDPNSIKPHTLWLYGMKRWGDIFNARQKLALVTFVEKVRLAHQLLLKKNTNREYVKALITYLAFGVDRLVDYNSSLTRWLNTLEAIAGTFSRQAFPMVWDYVELNPLSGAMGGWNSALNWICKVISHCSHIPVAADVAQGSATRLPYPDNFFDAVITDPPYYDNIEYAELSDFFYVWLKRTIGHLYPEIFSTPLTPKSQEIVENVVRQGGDRNKAKAFFESMLTHAFHEIFRVTNPEGIVIIVFAHKSTDAWETVINSVLKSGLVLTASWPIQTERKVRIRAKGTASLISSVYMVCRKKVKKDVAYFNEIRSEIENRIKRKLAQFWEQGISGADFFVSAIGPAVEVFGKYARVEKLSGEEVSVQELLEYVRKVVSEFALERVLKRADLGGVDAETRFYLLWRWTFGNSKVHFDDAIKLSRPMGVELTQLWDGGSLVKKEKEFVRVLAPHERAKDPAFLKKTKFTSMIDVLHYVLALWERGEREKIKEVLNETGYAGNEIFWQTAQAISEILPQGDKEKQLLQGFLYGKEVYVKEARGKTSLLDYMESK